MIDSRAMLKSQAAIGHQQIDILLIGFSLLFDLLPTNESTKAEKYKSRLLLEYNLVVNCSASFKLFLLFPGPMTTSLFKVDTEPFLLIAFRLSQAKKAKCHTSDAT